ncbi:hypothetical protein F5Y18DRAFT_218391 [Xylariaceae sp. FL1019]|nr:hypothetical protein F5Y18DRAFT_218391 [Xylariaceae sp. FL1019]
MGSQDDPRVKFGLSCPDGGDFYVCQDSRTKFIGCCGEDPCTAAQNGICPDNELYNATFSASTGVNFLEQSCGDSSGNALWYTCSDASPPFLGCCRNNPCNNGCEDGNLVAAVLSDDPENASQFLLPETTTTTASGSSTSPTTTNTSSASPTNSDTTGSESSKSSAGLIVGLSLAGVVILLIVLGLYLWSRRREANRSVRESQARLEEEQARRLNEHQGLFTEDVTRPSMNPNSSPPMDRDTFPANTSTRASQDPQPSPGFSDSTNPHLSQVSELEGSAIMRALHPQSPEAYRGFNGRESGQHWR